jgi:hypothetical protein
MAQTCTTAKGFWRGLIETEGEGVGDKEKSLKPDWGAGYKHLT